MSDNLNTDAATDLCSTLRICKTITPADYMQLQKLCDMCDGYEPYISQSGDRDIVQAAAYDTASGIMTGFVGILINEHEYEVTAVTHPDYRKQGIFSTLFGILHNNILEADKCALFTAALPKYLSNTSVNKGELYSELLMKLSSVQFSKKCIAPWWHTSSDNDVSDDVYEALFSDDNSNYLLYIEDSDEPAAVCDLTYEASFTVISGVFVDLAQRKKGIGTLFMTKLISDYFDNYSNPLILHVNSNNKAALRLYERCGFEIIDKIDYYLL